ncbi:ATP-dependent 6-phosphofructokinase [Oceanidesulfovibrio marinus]|uniref:ATP-dependent 6-phosphofructokinase n=1 Tax=Oceanidesulfovibrio marinus TaxID=370038 RepID=A0A6P1ZFX2_9BACT|nr:ATP-dependent 6-phosphofructokinase [Oceanidesulfovibrio marinus]QJT08463.1 ATP-dependent 6-phosphofructokinase [Oceanidesulfovibrio marinus]TVM33071.1 ATP-dependent 6-phosphofructokinase [Oceanidesulfovibrio marinus]
MSNSRVKRALDVETGVATLGKAKIPSKLSVCHFTDDDAKVLIQVTEEQVRDLGDEPLYQDFELAGPRHHLYFDPTKTKCAIVTCGGLCPGVNDVIRAIVMEAHHSYNVASVLGIRFGLEGFIPSYGHDVVELTPQHVASSHQFGGTILGSSRGPQPAEDIVDALERMNVNCLFLIGGDGTMRAAGKIADEIASRKLKIAIIGIPKTIDNDINFITKSFGFDTAVEKATEAIQCAHTEAICAVNGIGMVKLMGRESGFIAAQATLALKEVNFVLVPETPFELDGKDGILNELEARLAARKHAVIVVAEGAGQHLLEISGDTDASGNPVLGDISSLLISRIKKHFAGKNIPITLKFIDPSYIIRSVPANANDRVYCGFLGQHAVHAAMAGKTGMVISKLQDRYVYLPLPLVTKDRRKLNINSDYWRAVMESTGQNPIPGIFGPGTYCPTPED